MAHGVRDIRRRIKAIKNTQQITKAMQMVAAARLRKAQARAVSARVYAGKLAEMLGRLTADGAHAGHPLLRARPVRKVTVVLLTADRGLAGSYNTNLFRRVEALMGRLGREENPPAVDLWVVGRKGRDHYRRRRVSMAREEIAIGDEQLEGLARAFAVGLIDGFGRSETDEVIVVYTKFLSALQQKPTELRLLPVVAAGRAGEQAGGPEAEPGVTGGEAAGTGAEGGPDEDLAASQPAGPAEPEFRYVYEPDPKTVYALLLPKFVSNQLFQALLEARASEYAARMTAMAAATDNAEEMVEKLTLDMHRARQASITQEIMELVGGAEAQREK